MTCAWCADVGQAIPLRPGGVIPVCETHLRAGVSWAEIEQDIVPILPIPRPEVVW